MRSKEGLQYPEKVEPKNTTSMIAESVVAGTSLGAALALGASHPNAVVFAVLSGLNIGTTGLVLAKKGGKKRKVAVGAAAGVLYSSGITLVVPQSVAMGIVGAVSSAAPLLAAHAVIAPMIREQIKNSVLNDMFNSPTYSLSDQVKLLKRIVGWAAEDKWLWFGAYLTLIANACLSSLMPLAFTSLVQSVTVPGVAFWIPVRNLTGVVMIMAALSSVQSIFFAESSTRLAVGVQKKLMGNVMKQDTEFFEATSPGEILTQISASGSMVGVVSGLIPTFIRSLVSTATTFVILSRYDVRLALICTVSVPFEVLSSYAYGKYFEKYNEKVQSINAKSSNIVTEMVSSVKTVRMFAAETEQLDRFWNSVDELVKLRRSNNLMLAGSGLVDVLLPHCTSMLMFIYAAHLAQLGQINMASLVTISMYQGTLTKSFESIMGIYVGWGGVMGTTRKVFEMLDREPKMAPRGEYIPETLQGAITLDNVSFTYASSSTPVLKNFSLRIEPGEVVALVGPSGGGKSTIVNMILGMYDPTEGSVLIDDVPINQYCPKYFHTKAITVVNQEPVLFSNSFTDNITLGLDDVPKEKVEEAAKQAFAHDFIIKMKDGYDSKCGARGERLSGGQRQRVAIARALVRDPSILLLDEATSALDGESESIVQEAIETLMEGRTTVVVAHRLSTIQKADRIIVVNKGEIVQEGTHSDLLARGGIYADLVRRQLRTEDVELPPMEEETSD